MFDGATDKVVKRQRRKAVKAVISHPETNVPVSLSDTIEKLKRLQRLRQFCIKSQSRCDRSVEALIAGFFGYASPKEKSRGRDEKDARKAVFAKAKQQRLLGEAQKPVDQIIDDDLPEIIQRSQKSRESWDNYREHIEDKMIALAKSLPVWPWVEGVAGFGAKGLAVIVGEAGDLGNYPDRWLLWKRLGLAVIGGERQQKKTNVEDAERHGYKPARRAEVYAFADPIFRHQWQGEDSAYREAISEARGGANEYDGTPLAKLKGDDLVEIADALGVVAEGKPKGPYGVIYGDAKKKAMLRVKRTNELDYKDVDKWTRPRAHNHAKRMMSKALIKDLRIAWKAVTPRLESA